MKFAIISFGLFTLWLCIGAVVVHEEGVPGGLLLNPLNRMEQSGFESTWQSKRVQYPIVGEYLVNIGYIKIENNLGSTPSTATKISGGVGQKKVLIEFYAPAYVGYNYTVEIRAQPLL